MKELPLVRPNEPGPAGPSVRPSSQAKRTGLSRLVTNDDARKRYEQFRREDAKRK